MENYFNIFLFAIILVLLYFLARNLYKKVRATRQLKRRFQRGRLLENQARDFLIAKGYRIVEEQKQFKHKYYVNRNQKSSLLKVDYYVSKNKKKFLVEVKSGQSAISTSNSNTRRQLLEYSFAMPNDGIFLLDMENQKLELVEFNGFENQSLLFFIKVVIIIAMTGILLPFWSLKIIIFSILSFVFLLKPRLLLSIAKHLNNLLKKE